MKAWLAAGLLLWVAAVCSIAPLAVAALAEGRPPLWDMAKNGVQAGQLSADLRSLNLVDFVFDLNRHDPWPFAYSLLLLPALLVAGPSLSAATAGQAFLFSLLPLAVLWAGRELDPSRAGLVAAIPAALLTIASPELRLLGILLLREVAGALLTLVALALYLRACRLRTDAAWRGWGLAALALTLTKYNYGLLLLAAAWIDQRLRRQTRERGPSRRVLLQTLALPLGVWFAIPRPAHLRGLFDFLHNRSSDLGLGAGVAFYPRSFASEYVSGAWWIGAAVLLLAVLGAALAWRHSGERSLALLGALGAALAVLHPYKQSRFLATVVPLLFLLASGAVARLAGRRASRLLGATLLCLPALGAFGDGPRLLEGHRWHSADPRLRAVLDFVAATAPTEGRFTTLGGFNELSPHAVAWAVIARPGSGAAAPQPPLPRGDLEAGLRKRPLDWIVTVRVEEASVFAANDDYRAHNAWQEAAVDELGRRGGPPIGSRRFPELGLEVAIRRPGGA